MNLTKDEKQSVKKMLLFLVKNKSKSSGGHCGFHPMELLPIIEELVQEEEIKARETIHARMYFLNTKSK